MTEIRLPEPRALTLTTLRDPSAAARALMALDLPRGTLWMALVLTAALQALLVAGFEIVSPSPVPLPGLLQSPLGFFAMSLVTLVASIYAIHMVGRGFGGTARLEDIMVLLAWLQALRVAVQASVMVLSLAVPAIAMLLVLAASAAGLWITLHFVKAAHRFDTLGRAVAVLVLAVLAMVVGLALTLSILGPSIIGLPADV